MGEDALWHDIDAEFEEYMLCIQLLFELGELHSKTKCRNLDPEPSPCSTCKRVADDEFRTYRVKLKLESFGEVKRVVKERHSAG